MTKSISIPRAAASLLLIGLLSACGGGGGYSDPVVTPAPVVTNEPPASASASDSGLVSYVLSLAATFMDMALPVDLSNFVPPAAAADNVPPVATINDSAS